jgi:hypothetical protein
VTTAHRRTSRYKWTQRRRYQSVQATSQDSTSTA